MEIALRWSSRNLSRLELTVALTLLLTFMGLLAAHGLRVYAAAEETAVRATVLNLNSALRLAQFQLVAADPGVDLQYWEGRNPVSLIMLADGARKSRGQQAGSEMDGLGRVPEGFSNVYAGEFEHVVPEDMEPGHWYFDRSEHALVYRVRNAEFFESGLAGPGRIRFGLRFRFDDLDRDGQYNFGMDRFLGFAIEPLDNYQWIERE